MKPLPAILAFVAWMACGVLSADTAQITVYVVGQVHKSGTYQVDPDAGASGAIALAGGTTDEADTTQIHILRHKPNSTSKTNYDVIVFNLSTFNNTGKGDIKLQDHDIVNVPARHHLTRMGSPPSVPTAEQPYTKAKQEYNGINQSDYTDGNDFILE